MKHGFNKHYKYKFLTCKKLKIAPKAPAAKRLPSGQRNGFNLSKTTHINVGIFTGYLETQI